ncbi:unnamed protein product, partial [marine sediment metagenome]
QNSPFATTDINGNFRQLEDVMLDLRGATSDMTAEQRKLAIANIFGDEAQRAVNLLLDGGVEKTKEYDRSLRSATGTANKMAKEMESGLGGTFRSLLSATEGLAISVGQFLKPAIVGITNILIGTASVLNKVVSFMNSGSLTADILTSAIWGITASLAAYKATTLIAAAQTAILASGMTFATLVSGGLTGALTLLNLSNPFGWIAIGITGLTLLYKKFKPFTDLVDGAISGLKTLFGIGGDEEVNVNGGGGSRLNG